MKKFNFVSLSVLFATFIIVAIGVVGCSTDPVSSTTEDVSGKFSPANTSGQGFQHAITVNLDGVDYNLAGAPDGPGGATDIPGHEWVMTGPNKLIGKHYNTGPFGASSWWASGVEDGALLFVVDGIIDVWTSEKAQSYANRGYIHYHEFVAVDGGANHPSKVVWLKHTAVMSFYFDGGPHPEMAHQVNPGLDYDFIPNGTMPYIP